MVIFYFLDFCESIDLDDRLKLIYQKTTHYKTVFHQARNVVPTVCYQSGIGDNAAGLQIRLTSTSSFCTYHQPL
jgi:hypothetical protein